MRSIETKCSLGRFSFAADRLRGDYRRHRSGNAPSVKGNDEHFYTERKAMSTLTVPVNSGDHVQGSNEAQVTLVEYGDYECPYCGEAHPIVKRLQKKMGG